MSKLLDRIKQGLRNIGRANVDHIPRSLPARSDDEAVPAQRMRSELDAVDVQGKPAQPQPRQPTNTRLRKATLSKARRTGPAQNAPGLWGISTPREEGLFGGMPTATEPLLTGATLVGNSGTEGERAQRHRSPDGFLEGAPPFSRPAEPISQADTLFGPAPSLVPNDDPKDRLFW